MSTVSPTLTKTAPVNKCRCHHETDRLACESVLAWAASVKPGPARLRGVGDAGTNRKRATFADGPCRTARAVRYDQRPPPATRCRHEVEPSSRPTRRRG